MNDDRSDILAKEKLVGRTITMVRYLTTAENDAMGLGFDARPLGIWFDDDTYLFATPSETGAGPAGTLCGGDGSAERTWAFPPAKEEREDPNRPLTDDEQTLLDSMTADEVDDYIRNVLGQVCFDNYRPTRFDVAVQARSSGQKEK
jgi:hypothetical protein